MLSMYLKHVKDKTIYIQITEVSETMNDTMESLAESGVHQILQKAFNSTPSSPTFKELFQNCILCIVAPSKNIPSTKCINFKANEINGLIVEELRSGTTTKVVLVQRATLSMKQADRRKYISNFYAIISNVIGEIYLL